MRVAKTRICVRIAPSGDWNAVGWYGANDNDVIKETYWGDYTACKIVWVEADVPVPEPDRAVIPIRGIVKDP